RFGVMGHERPIDVADEHQVAGGREHAAEVRVFSVHSNLGLAGHRIDRLDAAAQALGRPGTAASEAIARLGRAALVNEVLLLYRGDVIAALLDRHIEQTELRIIRAGLPVLAAEVRWTEPVALRPCARAMAARGVFLDVLSRIVIERAASFRIETGRPIELVDVLLAGDERAV